MAALAPYANLVARNIRLIKHKQTGQNRGFAFVQLPSPLVCVPSRRRNLLLRRARYTPRNGRTLGNMNMLSPTVK